jgi:nitrate/nitrite-specific signal transduction histidine kinase
MTFGRLRWLAVIAPACLITLFEILRHTFLDGILHLWAGSLLVLVVMLVGAFFFSRTIFDVIERMQRELLLRNQELSARNAVGVAVSESVDLEETLHRALDKVLEITGSQAGEIFVWEEEAQELVLRAHRGFNPEAFREVTRFGLGEGLPGLVARSGEPILVQGLGEDQRFIRRRVVQSGFQSFAGVPLKSKNRLVGVMNVASLDYNGVSRQELELLTAIGNQIGVAIENGKLMEQMRHFAVLEERDRIGREIHDSFAQTLGYLNLQTRAIEDLLKGQRYEEALGSIRQMRDGVKEAFTEVREAIFSLRTALAPGRDVKATLQDYLREFSQNCGISAELHVEGAEVLRFPPGVEVQLVRIIQEALTNVRKHAWASKAVVSFQRDNGHMVVSIEDDGQGFDPSLLSQEGQRRFGLSIMRERAEGVGATFDILTQPGKGTKVIVALPMDGSAGVRGG